MNYFERLSESIPNKFAGDLGPYSFVSSTKDAKGLYTHWGSMWLIGFVIYKAPNEYESFEGARELRKMTPEEIKTYLNGVVNVHGGKEDAMKFVAFARKKLETQRLFAT